MFLRLKPSIFDPRGPKPEPCESSGWSISQATRDRLLRGIVKSFDWNCGGPAGPIKFVDLDLLEFLSRRALVGDGFARRMASLYLKGIARLIDEQRGAAAQYSIGSSWNAANHHVTLAGQALVLRALAFSRCVVDLPHAVELGLGIDRFVQRQIGLFNTYNCGPAQESKYAEHHWMRDSFWYTVALLEFARTFSLPRPMGDAISLLDQALELPRVVNVHENHTDKTISLDERVTVASALALAARVTGSNSYATRAVTLCAKTAELHGLRSGGLGHYPGSSTESDTAIDIDCTLSLVRTSIALSPRVTLNRSRLIEIIELGTRGLFNPIVALARRPEAGIRLVAEEKDALSAAPSSPLSCHCVRAVSTAHLSRLPPWCTQ